MLLDMASTSFSFFTSLWWQNKKNCQSPCSATWQIFQKICSEDHEKSGSTNRRNWQSDWSIHGRRQRGGRRVVAPWVFINDTDIVDRGLIVVFFGLFLLFFGHFSGSPLEEA